MKGANKAIETYSNGRFTIHVGLIMSSNCAKCITYVFLCIISIYHIYDTFMSIYTYIVF